MTLIWEMRTIGPNVKLVETFQMEEKYDYLEIEGSEPPTIW